ncbi:hypothetical protein ACQCN2_14570 [Brevibacillus ginsengisoli]|uniref:hypothetical protein n=1 Tax=Brevibacillus ginsengisoli TaxID=363854 RepID=UPI003CF61F7E
MSLPFESFTTELNYLQVSLLLDTVSYFEESPKLLSIPSQQGSVAVPLLPAALQAMLEVLEKDSPAQKSEFSFAFEWVDESSQKGLVRIGLPTKETIEQETDWQAFSAV